MLYSKQSRFSAAMAALALAVLFLLTAEGCNGTTPATENTPAPSLEAAPEGIYLYGESHGREDILTRELSLWQDCYARGMRHLFVEMPYYTAEYMNQWMQAEDDSLLLALYADWEGSLLHNETYLRFYRSLKETCPETVFHGTDVGHQLHSTGQRYLNELKAAGQQDTEAYARTLKALEQGRTFYYGPEEEADAYRETCLVENFLEAYAQLEGEAVMGIYGANHLDFTDSHPNAMWDRLREQLGDALHREDLRITEHTTLEINGKSYAALCYGSEDISQWNSAFGNRTFYLLEESAYEDFRNAPLTNDVLPLNQYPMELTTGQVLVVEYAQKDGSLLRLYYRTDGTSWQDMPVSVGFTPEAEA